jgi:alkyl hydroperoxide reductase subunit D
MLLASLKSSIPDYAKDIRLNLDSVLAETGAAGLTGKQISLIALSSAIASRHPPLVAAIEEFGAQHANTQELNGARTAAAIMAMNNVYYRFTHLVGDTEYSTMRAGLRMNAMSNPGCDKIDFELCSLAVSAINGCGMCMDSHEKNLRKHNISAQGIQSAVRIASVIHAAAVTLEQQASTNAPVADLAA